MKKYLMKTITVTLAILMILIAAIPIASADTLRNEDQKVSITVNCNKPGYTFELFQVASLNSTVSGTAYETAYTPLFDDIADEVKSGNTKSILLKLDAISPALSEMPATAISYGTFESANRTKTFSNLEQGIYYVKCIKFPAGVTAVENSVVALPYFSNNNWVYTIDPINLATKVADDTPNTVKEITNSTKNNVNYTDVALGETVEFAIYNRTTGSSSFKINKYTVYDKMSAGLTFDKNSVKVYLADSNKQNISRISTNDYKVNVTASTAGQATEFNVALNQSYLSGNDFYASDVKYVIITYSAKLNTYAVKGAAGNPNEDVKLEYGNESTVDSVPGNKVYVYTYGVGVTKLNENGSALAGAKFGLFASNEAGTAKTTQLATGISDNSGKVRFLNSSNEEISLRSGKYFVSELEAPSGYQLLGKDVLIELDVDYLDSFANETWVENAPADGVRTISVTDTKLIVPQTGGHVERLYIAGIISLLLCGALFIAARRMKKNHK